LEERHSNTFVMSRKILLIKHNDAANDDRTATHLAARGFDLEWRRPFAGEALPADVDGLAGLIVHGGSQPVPEADRYPFLRDEMRFMGRCLKAELPVLGICLGSQLLAHELGAPVGPHPEGYHEFGYYELFPTPAGHDEIPAGLHVTQSHYHEFGVPAGATLLARSALYAHQAFRYGRNAYGLQFHAEVTRDIFRRWQNAHGAHYIGQPGVASREQQDRDALAYDAAQHAWFTGFLDRLFGTAALETTEEPAIVAAC
jgi:GMP synthase (glutamine-hydrolysing)